MATSRTDGKRKVFVRKAKYGHDSFDIGICKNGFQTDIVSMDKEMLAWLKEIIVEIDSCTNLED